MRLIPIDGVANPPINGALRGTPCITTGTFVRALGLPVPVLAQDREEEMILPFSLDAEVLSGVALLPKSGSCQQRLAGNVGRQTCGLYPMQAQPVKGEVEYERQRRGHVALPRKGLADPITEARGLGDAAPQIGQADAADQGLVMC